MNFIFYRKFATIITKKLMTHFVWGFFGDSFIFYFDQLLCRKRYFFSIYIFCETLDQELEKKPFTGSKLQNFQRKKLTQISKHFLMQIK